MADCAGSSMPCAPTATKTTSPSTGPTRGEDFERKLYRKRAKISVRFVELTDTIPGAGTGNGGRRQPGCWATFLALLDERERQVVVLLRSGYTKVGEVATILGYKNHSPECKHRPAPGDVSMPSMSG